MNGRKTAAAIAIAAVVLGGAAGVDKTLSNPTMRNALRETVGYHAASLEQAEQNEKSTQKTVVDKLKQTSEDIQPEEGKPPQRTLHARLQDFAKNSRELEDLRDAWKGDQADLQRSGSQLFERWLQKIQSIQDEDLKDTEAERYERHLQAFKRRMQRSAQGLDRLNAAIQQGEDLARVGASREFAADSEKLGGEIDEFSNRVETQVADYVSETGQLLAFLQQGASGEE